MFAFHLLLHKRHDTRRKGSLSQAHLEMCTEVCVCALPPNYAMQWCGDSLLSLVNVEGPWGTTSILPGSIVTLKEFLKRKKIYTEIHTWWDWSFLRAKHLAVAFSVQRQKEPYANAHMMFLLQVESIVYRSSCQEGWFMYLHILRCIKSFFISWPFAE